MERETGNFVNKLVQLWLLSLAIFGTVTLQAQTTKQAVYEPGDFYLPSSRVYIHVGKTGFGHEHAVEGQVKRGTVHLDAARDSGEIVFDMTTFQEDSDSARKYVGLTDSTSSSTKQQVNKNMLLLGPAGLWLMGAKPDEPSTDTAMREPLPVPVGKTKVTP